MMGEPTHIISNVTAGVVIGGLTAFVMLLPASPASRAGAAGPRAEEFSIEAAPPEPEPPKPEEPKPVAAAAPEPVVAEVTPPSPPPPEEPQKTSQEPPKPVEMLKDEDGEVTKGQVVAVVTEEVKAEFAKCLRKNMTYPSSREAQKQQPHGAVHMSITYSGAKLVAFEVLKSSGSPILDQTARSNVLTSDCGSVANSGWLTITMNY
jgi:outer membrane biosynthesis protein TonB